MRQIIGEPLTCARPLLLTACMRCPELGGLCCKGFTLTWLGINP